MGSSLWQGDMDLPDPATPLHIPANHIQLTSLVQSPSLHPPSGSPVSSSSFQLLASPLSTDEASPARICRKRKRKSRAKPKAPVVQLCANRLNFKEIVHQFTGVHSSLSLHPASFCKPVTFSSTPSVEYVPTVNDVLFAGIAHSLKALQSLSAHFLLQELSSEVHSKVGEAHAPAMASSNVCRCASSCVSSEQVRGSRDLLASAQLLGVDILSKAQELERFLLKEDGFYEIADQGYINSFSNDQLFNKLVEFAKT